MISDKSLSRFSCVFLAGTHSARSVDGGIPATDSNIINLAITPFARGQGFSAAKGRNLGFANDASLNAIPAGINNELSNVDVRGTTQPQQNTVLRDSYGNPVTPFTDLAKPELDSVGFLTNVNRGANFQSAGQYNFKVPSYASGIIEPIGQPNFGLLPPNPVPSTVQVVPPRSTTTAKPFSTQQQFLPNAKIPTIEEVYDIKVGTERSTIFARDPFVGPVKPTPQQPSVPQASVGPDSIVGYKTDVNQQTNFPKPGSPATETRFSGSTAPAGPTFATTSKPVVQKYNGGFGGPAGFLGNQQNLGTAYTSTVRPNVPQVVPTAPQPPQQRPQTVFIPQNQSPTTARPEDKTTVQKYVGSFGGPPGFLDGETQNGPLLDRLLVRLRRQTGGVNYGFPTFPDFARQGQQGNFGHPGFGGGGLFSRSDFSDFMPDASQFKGNQVWTTKSCVYDEKGKEKCVERHGDKPKH
uniref:Uncharacterized protein n=1 Tax=Anopheles stephensi TaxID=30069 RepID=A0A182YE60_ANOST